jgi:hypothetical protein
MTEETEIAALRREVAELREHIDFVARSQGELFKALNAKIDTVHDIVIANLEHLKQAREARQAQEAAANAGDGVEPGKFDEARADVDRWG